MPKLVLKLHELQELGREATFHMWWVLQENAAVLSQWQLMLSSLGDVPVDRECRNAVEDVGLHVCNREGFLDRGGRKGVMDHHEPPSPRGHGSHEGHHMVAEVGRGGLEGRHELGREFRGGARVGTRRGERLNLEAVEVEEALGGGSGRVPSMQAELGLVDMGGGGDVVDGDAVGSDETGEVEELVEVTLGGKGYHDHSHPRRCRRRRWLFPGVDGVSTVRRGKPFFTTKETEAMVYGKITNPIYKT